MPIVLIIWGFFVFLFCYLLGSIPFSWIVATLYGKNLYQVGSGNVGAANVWRATQRVEALLMALAGDVGKGALAIFLAQKFSESCFAPYLSVAQTIAAFSVILGHNWPIFLKFKGGRGLAALGGAVAFLNIKLIFIVLVTIAFFIFLTELVMKKGIKIGGNLKEKIKGLFTIFISQVLGRMIGILAAVILVLVFYPQIFKVVFPAVILSGIKHIKRTKDFLKKK
jgi:glycerol-3-phosphate acyltransferase PlsY